MLFRSKGLAGIFALVFIHLGSRRAHPRRQSAGRRHYGRGPPQRRGKAALDSGPRRLVILEGGHRLSASVRRPGRGNVKYLRVAARRLNRLLHPRGAADDNAPQLRPFVRIPSGPQGQIDPSSAASPLLEVVTGLLSLPLLPRPA